jgi:hypothetical protein
MYRLEVKIPSNEKPGNYQIIWNDVPSIDAGKQQGKWMQESYKNAGKIDITYEVLKGDVKYRYSAFIGFNVKGQFYHKSNWFDDAQDAANYGWLYMKTIKEQYGEFPSVNQVVDNNDELVELSNDDNHSRSIHIIANLLDNNECIVKPKLSAEKHLLVLNALNKIWITKMNREVSNWAKEDSDICDITIKAPQGVFAGDFGSGMRVINIKNDAQFLIYINDIGFMDFFDALKEAGRAVNEILFITMTQ